MGRKETGGPSGQQTGAAPSRVGPREAAEALARSRSPSRMPPGGKGPSDAGEDGIQHQTHLSVRVGLPTGCRRQGLEKPRLRSPTPRSWPTHSVVRPEDPHAELVSREHGCCRLGGPTLRTPALVNELLMMGHWSR